MAPNTPNTHDFVSCLGVHLILACIKSKKKLSCLYWHILLASGVCQLHNLIQDLLCMIHRGSMVLPVTQRKG